jgi:hypothetical protein
MCDGCEELIVVEKYFPPTRLDMLKFNTLWKNIETDIPSYYIQTSHDKENPNWISLGYLFEKTLTEEFIRDEQFRNKCLKLYNCING